ncbi:MAG: hypothetical protein ACOCWQ_02735 [Nanoarchaeota archaeon]
MGIQVEFNPDLALRDISEYEQGRRMKEECIPEEVAVGEVYAFLKKGQRNYWLEGELPLLETKGNQQLSRPRASIIICEATHFLRDRVPYTRGTYKVIEVFDLDDPTVHFDGFSKVQ